MTNTMPPAELKQLIDAGNVIDLIDVRTRAEFESIHARGARSAPLDRLDPASIVQGRRGAADQPIYLICKGGNRSAKACEKFEAAGIGNVLSVAGGTDAWAAAGLPVVRGRGVISLERQVRIAAGALVLAGVALGTWVHAGFYGIAAFVGAGLVFSGATDWCGMGMLLARMPWNRGKGACASQL